MKNIRTNELQFGLTRYIYIYVCMYVYILYINTYIKDPWVADGEKSVYARWGKRETLSEVQG